VGRNELPTPPVEIADEVELYARESGRHATMHFVPTFAVKGQAVHGAWVIRFTLRENDPRLGLVQGGQVKELTEDVWLHEPNPKYGREIPGSGGAQEPEFRGVDIYQLGASGVRTFLEKGNTWSGRGEHRSIEDQAQKAMEANRKMREKHRADQKEENRHEQRETRRSRFNIPFLNVGIDIGRRTNKESTP